MTLTELTQASYQATALTASVAAHGTTTVVTLRRALTVRSPSRAAVRMLDLFGLSHVIEFRIASRPSGAQHRK